MSEVNIVLGTSSTPASGHPSALGTELEHLMMALGILNNSLHLPVRLYFVLFALLITYNYIVLLFVSQIGLRCMYYAGTISSLVSLWLQILTGLIILLRFHSNMLCLPRGLPWSCMLKSYARIKINVLGIYHFWHNLIYLTTCLLSVFPLRKQGLVYFAITVSRCLEQQLVCIGHSLKTFFHSHFFFLTLLTF